MIFEVENTNIQTNLFLSENEPPFFVDYDSGFYDGTGNAFGFSLSNFSVFGETGENAKGDGTASGEGYINGRGDGDGFNLI